MFDKPSQIRKNSFHVVYRGWIWLVCLALIGGPSLSNNVQAAHQNQMNLGGSEPQVDILEDGILLTWQVPQVEYVEMPGGEIKVIVRGYETVGQPGAPLVPFASTLVALPPEANPELEIIGIENENRSLPSALAIAPEPDEAMKIGTTISPKMTAALATPFNPKPVEWQHMGVMRGVSLARITFYPVLPEGDGINLVRRVQARFNFHSSKQAKTPLLANWQTDPLLNMLRRKVVNPEQIQLAERAGISQLAASNALNSPTSSVLIIEVEQAGITALTYEGLLAAGFPVSQVNPHNLHITTAGNEVAGEWDGDADTAFEPGERLLFFADPVTNRWARYDTYLLSESALAGKRMGARSANPSGVLSGNAFVDQVVEQNLNYTPQCYCGPTPYTRDGDRWVWQALNLPDSILGKFTTSISNLDPTRAGKLTVFLIGYTDVIQNPDHRVQVFFNATQLGQTEWNGKQAVQTEYDLPVGLLKNGINELALNLPGIAGVSKEGIWLDAFVVRFALGSGIIGASSVFFGELVPRAYNMTLNASNGLRAYQVTDPANPLRLTEVLVNGTTISFKDPDVIGPQRYAVINANGIRMPVRLRLQQTLPIVGQAGFNGADYLVITTPDFSPAMNSLVALRQSQGLTTWVQLAQPIFDQYSAGIPNPQAIRQFLQNAYFSWPTRPKYVLLVGDGNYDPKHYKADSWTSFIPPYMEVVDPWAGEVAADNRFVTVDGIDRLPDMLIGRFPVNTLTEAQIVVNKIVNYETSVLLGPWTRDVVFIADNPDTGGDFTADSEYLATNDVPPPYIPQRIYYTPPANTAAEVRNSVLGALNNGSHITVYTGHASQLRWAIESFLYYDDITGLSNQNRLPVILENTCFTGYFQQPNRYSLDEGFLLHPAGGAVAVWGASGLGLAAGQRVLMDGFLRSIYLDNQPGLGQATLAGRTLLATTAPAYIDLVDTFHLFGDPATSIGPLIDYQSLFLPLIRR